VVVAVRAPRAAPRRRIRCRLSFGRQAWAEDPQARTAYNLACTEARRGDLPAALGWLAAAATAGFDDVAHMEGDADLAQVRAQAGYGPVRDRMARSPRRGGAPARPARR
jgi:hypothetical protein